MLESPCEFSAQPSPGPAMLGLSLALPKGGAQTLTSSQIKSFKAVMDLLT